MNIPKASPGKRIRGSKKADFFIAASGLLAAGLKLDEVLSLISESRTGQVSAICIRIRSFIHEGHSLEMAMKSSKGFDDLDVLLCGVGERSASLTEVFSELGAYYHKRRKIRQGIIKASAYPLMVLLIAVVALLVMSIWVIPSFEVYYINNGIKLPALTRLLLSTAAVLPRYIVLFVIMLNSFVAIDRLLIFSTSFQVFKQGVLSRIPLIGQWIIVQNMERLVALAGIMMNAGMSLSNVLQILSEQDPSYGMRKTCKNTLQQLSRGYSLHESLLRSGVREAMLIQLIKTGEASGKLCFAFRQAAVFYQEKLQEKSTRLTQWFEPALVLVTGLIVGVMLAGLYLPMFEMGQMMGM